MTSCAVAGYTLATACHKPLSKAHTSRSRCGDPYFNEGKPFADVVAYWPALGKWTVTGTVRGNEDVEDVPVRIVGWQYLPPLPLWVTKGLLP